MGPSAFGFCLFVQHLVVAHSCIRLLTAVCTRLHVTRDLHLRTPLYKDSRGAHGQPRVYMSSQVCAHPLLARVEALRFAQRLTRLRARHDWRNPVGLPTRRAADRSTGRPRVNVQGLRAEGDSAEGVNADVAQGNEGKGARGRRVAGPGADERGEAGG